MYANVIFNMIGIDEVGRGCVGGPLVVVGVYLSPFDLARLQSDPSKPWIGDSKRLRRPADRTAAVTALWDWCRGGTPTTPGKQAGAEASAGSGVELHATVEGSAVPQDRFHPEYSSGVFGNGSRYERWIAESEEIDADNNILNTTMRGMNAVLRQLLQTTTAEVIAVDGNRFRAEPDLAHVAVQTVVGGDATNVAISIASMLAKTIRDQCIDNVADRLTLYGNLRDHQGYGTAKHRTAIELNGWVQGFHRYSFMRKWKLFPTPSSTLAQQSQ